MVTVACVLKSGGWCTPEYVYSLQAGVEKYLSREHTFVCLTDKNIAGVECIRFDNEWPGWWSKIELFRKGLFKGPVLYLDLDTVLVSNFDSLFKCNQAIAMIDNFYHPEYAGSGVLYWNGDMSFIYDAFRGSAENVMSLYQRWGDQLFIERLLKTRGCIKEVPRLHEWAKIVSYKRDIRDRGRVIPPGTQIICFHGTPKPHDSGVLPCVQKYWRI